MHDQGTNRKGHELSRIAQFLICVAAGVGTIYGMSHRRGELNIPGAIGVGLVLLIVAVFLIVSRKK
jgi:hypothetical protein